MGPGTKAVPPAVEEEVANLVARAAIAFRTICPHSYAPLRKAPGVIDRNAINHPPQVSVFRRPGTARRRVIFRH